MVTKEQAVIIANTLKSDGSNVEYDRALCELLASMYPSEKAIDIEDSVKMIAGELDIDFEKWGI